MKPYDSGSPEDVERKAREAKRAQARRLADVAEVMSTQAGRRFVHKLLTDCRVFDHVWDPGAMIHFNAGRQALGQDLFKEVMLLGSDPALDSNPFLVMMHEAKAKEEQNDG